MSRPRLTIGTYGEIATRRRPSGRIEARARYRDWDGATRLVQKTSGIPATVVGGQVVVADGEHTGALPGRLLRGPLARRGSHA